jgi:hypothetical protein
MFGAVARRGPYGGREGRVRVKSCCDRQREHPAQLANEPAGRHVDTSRDSRIRAVVRPWSSSVALDYRALDRCGRPAATAPVNEHVKRE